MREDTQLKVSLLKTPASYSGQGSRCSGTGGARLQRSSRRRHGRRGFSASTSRLRLLLLLPLLPPPAPPGASAVTSSAAFARLTSLAVPPLMDAVGVFPWAQPGPGPDMVTNLTSSSEVVVMMAAMGQHTGTDSRTNGEGEGELRESQAGRGLLQMPRHHRGSVRDPESLRRCERRAPYWHSASGQDTRPPLVRAHIQHCVRRTAECRRE